MWDLARCTVTVITASLALAHGAAAVMDEDEGGESEFVRTGFYLGVGGTAAFGHHWDNDVDDHLNEDASDLATENAQAALDLNPPATDTVIPVTIQVNGADLEDALFGVNGVIGYRAGALVAFEVEGEYLISSNESGLNVDSVQVLAEDDFDVLQSSTGTHWAKIEDIWAITANVKIYPPFEGWLKPLERFQPFAKVGLGVLHSKFSTEVESEGLTTTNTAETQEVPADFRLKSSDSNIDGALRVGGGIDIYATRNLVAEINTTYVLPFSDVGFLKTDYVSVQWRLVYRF